MSDTPRHRFSAFQHRQGMDADAIREAFVDHLQFSLGKDDYSATPHDAFSSLALAVRDRLIERWIQTQQTYYDQDVKRVHYLSLEFLMGRALGNSLINLGIYDEAGEALKDLGYEIDEIQETEPDAGLGNGGLGRLAACFLDSMATLELPACGYGIRYEYGIFRQSIIGAQQHETPDNWLRYGNPWEIPRPEYLYPVHFYGRVQPYTDAQGRLQHEWVDTEDVMALAYDTPIPGYDNNTVNTMRLWSAKATREFNLDHFTNGQYELAVVDKIQSETITRVLYPNDNFFVGRNLRLRQQYFLVSASLQDILRRYRKFHDQWEAFPEKNAIQLNDTHPAIAIPELMRVLVDLENLDWETAWDISTATFAYTNHTVLPEALEKWRVSLLAALLPRHLEIIYEINRRFLEQVADRFPGDEDRLRRMSIIEEGDDRRIRMAYLAIVGSHKVNGVAELHTRILKEDVFRDFHEMWPGKFTNKTNGITQRRWLNACNPGQAGLINRRIGNDWVCHLDNLKDLEPFADDPGFQDEWSAVQRRNKEALSKHIRSKTGLHIAPDSIFDCQVKRIHEYKRQLLNVLHVLTLYGRIKDDPNTDFTPRTVIFGGKAAPGYINAKLIIRLINDVARVVNNDEYAKGRLHVVFLADYNVSLAERIIPAADLSEQISTAGMEASGTGNMKFALNGALTIGTLDGANIEIKDAVGEDNIFIFGLTADEVYLKKAGGYDPYGVYRSNPELERVIDWIRDGLFSSGSPDVYEPLVSGLLYGGDPYMVLEDYAAYIACQDRVDATFTDRQTWNRMSILNTARIGRFSSDRTIREYADEIWDAKSVPIEL